jgi:phosphatidylglycerol:prolipoprotein diacylglycerol transferase
MFPRLFQLGDFSMPTYGVLVSVGIILGLWVSARNSERQGTDAEKARTLGTLVVLSGLIGAKVLSVVNDWSFFVAHPREIFTIAALRSGGVFLGGLIAAVLAAAWYVRKNSMPALAMCDAFAPGIALGHAVGRIGCVAAGCCWGKPTDSFWGTTFTHPLAHAWTGAPLGTPLVPTQLLESVVEFANFLFLMRLARHQKSHGLVIGAYLFLYGVARYCLEYLRDDPGRGSVFGGAMSGTQLISILMIVVGAFLSLRSLHARQNQRPADRYRTSGFAISDSAT